MGCWTQLPLLLPNPCMLLRKSQLVTTTKCHLS
jgi:hypothetical protein